MKLVYSPTSTPSEARQNPLIKLSVKEALVIYQQATKNLTKEEIPNTIYMEFLGILAYILNDNETDVH